MPLVVPPADCAPVQEYGPVVRLRLGSTDCVVVQGEQQVRETLITKADHFDSRPNFVRFTEIFGGSKKNGKNMGAELGSVYSFIYYCSRFILEEKFGQQIKVSWISLRPDIQVSR